MGLELTAAQAISANQVQVTFNAAPLQDSPLSHGSIYDLSVLTISSPNRAAYTVLAVEQVSTTVWVYTIFEPMEDWHTVHTVAYSDLLDASNKSMDSGFTSLTFLGLQDEASIGPPVQVQTPSDISNTSTLDSNPGTLAIGPDGDYAEDTGLTLLRKLVARRLFTPKGGFFHLPDYGLGFGVKEPINPTRLVALQTEVIRQVKLEPEIASVSATITVGVGDPAITVIQISGTTRSGQPFGPWEMSNG